MRIADIVEEVAFCICYCCVDAVAVFDNAASGGGYCVFLKGAAHFFWVGGGRV